MDLANIALNIGKSVAAMAIKNIKRKAKTKRKSDKKCDNKRVGRKLERFISRAATGHAFGATFVNPFTKLTEDELDGSLVELLEKPVPLADDLWLGAPRDGRSEDISAAREPGDGAEQPATYNFRLYDNGTRMAVTTVTPQRRRDQTSTTITPGVSRTKSCRRPSIHTSKKLQRSKSVKHRETLPSDDTWAIAHDVRISTDSCETSYDVNMVPTGGFSTSVGINKTPFKRVPSLNTGFLQSDGCSASDDSTDYLLVSDAGHWRHSASQLLDSAYDNVCIKDSVCEVYKFTDDLDNAFITYAIL